MTHNQRHKGIETGEVLAYTRAFFRKQDRIPTQWEIANHFKLRSNTSARWHLCKLVNAGELERVGRNLRFPRRNSK